MTGNHEVNRTGQQDRKRILILRGRPGSGKTTICLKARELARMAGIEVSGVVSVLVDQSGPRERIVLDARTGAQAFLARQRTRHEPGELSWVFDPQGLAWGRQIVQNSLPTRLFLIDELGPLELTSGQGWANVLDVLASGAYELAVVVLRPTLESQFRSALENALGRQSAVRLECLFVDVTPTNRDDLPRMIISLIEEGYD